MNDVSVLSGATAGESVQMEVTLSRPVGRGEVRGVRTHPSPPGGPKRFAWWYRKIFKMVQNNVVMVELTVWMRFKQFEVLKFQNFLGEHTPGLP